MINEFNYLCPANLEEVYSLLRDDRVRPLAGATDLIPRMRRMKLPIDTLVDISHLEELKGIRVGAEGVDIGALCTHSGLITSELLLEKAVSLVEAASSIGCEQTRNRGTLGGNIANASPAADTVPPMLTFDAVIKIGSPSGGRSMALDTFLTGPGTTALKKGELIERVIFRPLSGYGLAFLKLGKRNGMSIAIASVATAIAVDEKGVITDARIAMGSVAPTAMRCRSAEKLLIGKKTDEEVFQKAGEAAANEISPIDDVRASAAYRRMTASALVVKALRVAERRID